MATVLYQLILMGSRRVAVSIEGEQARLVDGIERTLDLARLSIARGETIAQTVALRGLGAVVDIDAALAEGRVLVPIDNPDPAHCVVTGTGLTHLGSAEARAAMQEAAAAGQATDTVRMFLLGLERGRPRAGEPGAQPEWFYKGDGLSIAGPGEPLPVPGFALDGGEEPEIAGLYVIGPDGTPHRLGFSLGNEFTDHVTERQNYLWLPHAKLRAASLGPELVVGPLPDHVEGLSRIERGGEILWEKRFVSGEANMSHTIANLEYHHFKYDCFRRPGDVHVHFFGTSTTSFSDGIKTEDGDVFVISASPFSYALRNTFRRMPRSAVPTVQQL